VRLTKLLRTTAFRLTLIYAALFTLSTLALLGLVYWNTVSYLDEQTDLSIQTEMDALREQYQQGGLAALRHGILQRSRVGHDVEQIYLLADKDYQVLAGNIIAWPQRLAGTVGWVDASMQAREDDEEAEKITARALIVEMPGGYWLLAGRNLHEREDLQEHTLQALLVALSLSLLLALAGGLVMSRSILRRIETINRISRSIMAGQLEQRMPITGNGDEFDQLAQNLNNMLDQIQRLMEGMRTVSDNVAHDLRSPLNRLCSRLEVALLNARSNDEYRGVMQQTLDDARSMLATFNALLSIAQAESGTRDKDWERLDVSTLAQGIAEFYQPVAEQQRLRFTQRIEPHISLYGNRHLLVQAIGNLLDNAIKYTPTGGLIGLVVANTRHATIITISDNGPGIPAHAREQVLERFFRLEASRTTPGNGLGLSLVRAVALLHHAKLELRDNHPGLIVSLSFTQNPPH
jgi:signal transduction histidine kinase